MTGIVSTALLGDHLAGADFVGLDAFLGDVLAGRHGDRLDALLGDVLAGADLVGLDVLLGDVLAGGDGDRLDPFLGDIRQVVTGTWRTIVSRTYRVSETLRTTGRDTKTRWLTIRGGHWTATVAVTFCGRWKQPKQPAGIAGGFLDRNPHPLLDDRAGDHRCTAARNNRTP